MSCNRNPPLTASTSREDRVLEIAARIVVAWGPQIVEGFSELDLDDRYAALRGIAKAAAELAACLVDEAHNRRFE